MFKQVELSFAFDALEPYIDELTMVTHYAKHHAAYTANFNAAVEASGRFKDKTVEEIFVSISDISDEKLRNAIRNNGGGYYNHNLYFDTLSPNGGGEPSGILGASIKETFGSFEAFKQKISGEAAGRFGSGWAWLNSDNEGNLMVSSSPNQDNPIMETEGKWRPIFAIDVWEHAYYLKYKNLRADYINALFNVIDWKKVGEYYSRAMQR